VGALVLRGRSSALVADALASLSAIAIDRNQSFEKEERAESARKSEQLRAAVMDALAHEFKTPLTAVQTASSGLLELKGLTDSQSDLVRLIDDEAIRLNALCTRLLQTAKLEAQKLDLEMEEVNLKGLVEEVLADNSKGREQERNPMQIAIDDPELTLRVDRGLLATILAQYIDNACKYSSPGTPIEIGARRSRTEILISVHNFGPTIPIEDREQVFERFYRSSALRDVAAGTGIGLSIVRKAAEAHHGHVWVISDEKEGTTFFLSLPSSARRKL
jgi:two-component system sensor histidine kinase KdpD